MAIRSDAPIAWEVCARPDADPGDFGGLDNLVVNDGEGQLNREVGVDVSVCLVGINGEGLRNRDIRIIAGCKIKSEGGGRLLREAQHGAAAAVALAPEARRRGEVDKRRVVTLDGNGVLVWLSDFPVGQIGRTAREIAIRVVFDGIAAVKPQCEGDLVILRLEKAVLRNYKGNFKLGCSRRYDAAVV